MRLRLLGCTGSLFAVIVLGCGGSDSPAEATGSSAASTGSSSTSAGSSSTSAGSSSTSAGTGGEGGGGAASFSVASHPGAPHVVSLGGPVLTAPKVIAITYNQDKNQADIDTFATKLAASDYWSATTSEYGVGPLTVGAPIHIADPAPTKTTDMAVVSNLQAKLTGPNPEWGAPDPSAIYTFVFPQGSAVDAGGLCCDGYDGYHDEIAVGTTPIAYAIVCTCPGFDGPGVSALGSVTTALSHELVEAATDPLVETDPAFAQADDPSGAWTLFTGGEVADMCELDADQYLTPADVGYVVQRSWSNAAAAAGDDPCVPPLVPADVYFNSVPVVSDVIHGQYYGPFTTKGVKIAIGASRTIDLDLFSEAPTTGPWTVAAYDYGDVFGTSPNLKLTLDQTTGSNGDVLKLTITVLKADIDLASEPFYIESTLGASSNVWMGVVGQ